MHFGAFQRVAGLTATATVVLALGLPVNLVAASTTAAPQKAKSTRPPVSRTTTPTAKKPAAKSTTTKRSYSASASRARRARIARARAEVRAREARELQTPRFKIDESGQEVPDVRAEVGAVAENGRYRFRPMMQVQHELRDALARQGTSDPAHERFTRDWNGRLRPDAGQRIEARAEARGEDERVNDGGHGADHRAHRQHRQRFDQRSAVGQSRGQHSPAPGQSRREREPHRDRRPRLA